MIYTIRFQNWILLRDTMWATLITNTSCLLKNTLSVYGSKGLSSLKVSLLNSLNGFSTEKEDPIVPILISFLTFCPLAATVNLTRPSIAKGKWSKPSLKRIWVDQEGEEGFRQYIVFGNALLYCKCCCRQAHLANLTDPLPSCCSNP